MSFVLTKKRITVQLLGFALAWRGYVRLSAANLEIAPQIAGNPAEKEDFCELLLQQCIKQQPINGPHERIQQIHLTTETTYTVCL